VLASGTELGVGAICHNFFRPRNPISTGLSSNAMKGSLSSLFFSFIFSCDYMRDTVAGLPKYRDDMVQSMNG
jgi:hypothetical protein